MNARRVLVTVVVFLSTFLVLTNALAMGMGNHVYRSKVKGPYHLVLRIGPAEKMGGMSGEQMLGGKMARCSMMSRMFSSSGSMGSGRCNHHVELHVFLRTTGQVVTKAKVRIRLWCISRKMNLYVPVMRMMAPKMGVKDFHYGNNIHARNTLYDVFVSVNGTHAEFPHVRLRA